MFPILTKPQIRKPPKCDWSKSNWLNKHINQALFTCIGESIAKPANKHRQQCHTSASIDSAHLSQWAWTHTHRDNNSNFALTIDAKWIITYYCLPSESNNSECNGALSPWTMVPANALPHFARSLPRPLLSSSDTFAKRLNRNRKTNNIESINNNNK